MLALLLLLLAAALGASHYWGLIRGGPISLAGYIAIAVGTVLTIGLGCVLMALSFYSARTGRDEEAQYQPHKKKDD